MSTMFIYLSALWNIYNNIKTDYLRLNIQKLSKPSQVNIYKYTTASSQLTFKTTLCFRDAVLVECKLAQV